MFSAAKVALAKLFRSRARSEDEGAGMGFFEHIEELRKTLFRCCAAFAVSAASRQLTPYLTISKRFIVPPFLRKKRRPAH